MTQEAGAEQTLSPADRDRQFLEALETLQDRIGYQFQNEGLLKQALTSASHARFHTPWGAANTVLEAAGDRQLHKLITAWIQKHVPQDDPDVSRFFEYLFNSNMFYSVTGMRLGLDKFVRISQARREGSDESGNMSLAERQQRMTADALEALAAALNQDGGKAALQKFVDQQLLSPHDDFVKDVLSLASLQERDIHTIFKKLTRGRGTIHIEKTKGGYLASVSFDGAPVQVANGRPDSLKVDAARYAVLGFFKNHPWLLWRFDGPASLVMPYTAFGAHDAGLPLQNRGLYESRVHGPHGGGILTFPPEQLKKIETWTVITLPPIEQTSDHSHGLFIDQLRHELAARNQTLTVRAPAHNPRGKADYAFFANNQIIAITWGASSLYDAAGRALNIYRAAYAQ